MLNLLYWRPVKNKSLKIFSFIKKRAACKARPFFIFLFFVVISATGVYAQNPIPSPLLNAYRQILSLKLAEGNLLLSEARDQYRNDPFYFLVHSYSETLYLLLTEDYAAYQQVKSIHGQYLKTIPKLSYDPAWKLTIEAEIRFHSALLKLKFNEELSGAWEFKQTYQLIQTINRKYPDFIHHQKLSGLFQLFLGSVPEKYLWLTNLFGYKGEISRGIHLLEQVENSNSVFALEAFMLRTAAQKYILKSSDCVSCQIGEQADKHRQNYLLAYLYSAVLVKEGQSDKALGVLSRYSSASYATFPLVYLLQGEILLYKGAYDDSRRQYLKFLKATKGKNHIKDAYYKIFLTYWLAGNDEKAAYYLGKIGSVGQEVYDSDKYAGKFARNQVFPDKHLMKARLSCDGGYLDKALAELSKYCLKREDDHADNIEFWYRKGRIFQLQGQYAAAIDHYEKVILLSEGKNHYFAPNACLQTGYMLLESGSITEAREYFVKALSYADHEYKNSIDNKARAALSESE